MHDWHYMKSVTSSFRSSCQCQHKTARFPKIAERLQGDPPKLFQGHCQRSNLGGVPAW